MVQSPRYAALVVDAPEELQRFLGMRLGLLGVGLAPRERCCAFEDGRPDGLQAFGGQRQDLAQPLSPLGEKTPTHQNRQRSAASRSASSAWPSAHAQATAARRFACSLSSRRSAATCPGPAELGRLAFGDRQVVLGVELL